METAFFDICALRYAAFYRLVKFRL